MYQKPKRWGPLSKKRKEDVVKFTIAYCEDNYIDLPDGVTRGTFAACIFYNVLWSGWIDRAVLKHIAKEGEDSDRNIDP